MEVEDTDENSRATSLVPVQLPKKSRCHYSTRSAPAVFRTNAGPSSVRSVHPPIKANMLITLAKKEKTQDKFAFGCTLFWRIHLEAFALCRVTPEIVRPLSEAVQTKYVCKFMSALKGQDMATGSVKWFNPTKGYGFIEPEDGSKDAFVHISAVEKAGLTSLREGQRVEFELVPGRNGKASAENLSVLD